jgi:hypothetical protein
MQNIDAGGLPATNEPAPSVDNSNTPNITTITPTIVQTPSAETAPAVEAPKAESPITTESKPKNILHVEDAPALTAELKQKLSRGDEKIAKYLDKFKNIEDLVKSSRELESKFHKTRALPELPKDATPEQVKEYREAAGIPDTWDKYNIELDGVNIGEADQPIVNDFLKRAHEKNLRPSEVKGALQTYFEVATQKNKEFIQNAEKQTAEVQKALQKEWGHNFDTHKNMITNHLQKEFGEEDFNKITSATLPDGTMLINNPKLLNYFLSGAKSSGQSHTILPNTNDPISLADRGKEIEKLQRENPQAYYNSPKISEEYKLIQEALKQVRNS